MGDERGQAAWEARREDLQRWLAHQWRAPGLALSGLEVPGHGGLSHETLLCEASWRARGRTRRQRLVVRLEPGEPRIFPHYDLRAQFRVMQILREHGEIPVPRVLGFEPSPRLLGRRFYVMERVEGRVPGDSPPFQLSGWLHDAEAEEQAVAQESLIEVLARLHRLDWRKLGLSFLDRREHGALGLDQEFGYWRHYLDWASRAHPLPVLEAAYQWCLEHRPRRPPPPVLNWGDARFGNVLYGDDFRPVAILDWEMALLGPAELDLGWLLFLHETALLWLPDLPGFRPHGEVVERYQQLLGRELQDLSFYEVWAGFRAAAIRAQIVSRDHALGRCPDLRGREEDNPVVASLRRRLELPEPSASP